MYSQALRVDPKNSETYRRRGMAHAETGDGGCALSDLSRAVEIAPDAANAYYDRGVLYARTDRRERSLRDLERAYARGSAPGCEGVRKLEEGR